MLQTNSPVVRGSLNMVSSKLDALSDNPRVALFFEAALPGAIFGLCVWVAVYIVGDVLGGPAGPWLFWLGGLAMIGLAMFANYNRHLAKQAMEVIEIARLQTDSLNYQRKIELQVMGRITAFPQRCGAPPTRHPASAFLHWYAVQAFQGTLTDHDRLVLTGVNQHEPASHIRRLVEVMVAAGIDDIPTATPEAYVTVAPGPRGWIARGSAIEPI